MKSDHIVIIFVVAVLAVVLGFAFMTFSNLGGSQAQRPANIAELSQQDILARLDPGPKPGSKAPDFQVTTTENKVVTLNDFKDKPAVLYFWATWCGTCRESLKELKKAYPDYEGKVNFIAIDVDTEETLDIISDFQKSQQLPGIFAAGNEKVIVDYYALTTSTKYALDESAIIVEKGASTYSADDWKKTFDKLLA